jgi:DNA-binding NtrC family response regulator
MADEDRNERSEQRLLVADSDVLVRHVIADYLRSCGYIVIEAASFEEALAVMEDDRLAPPLALCDADLAGGGNGFALRVRLASVRPDAKVILAGNAAAAAKAAGDLCDEGPHLARPYDPQLVVERIRRHLATRATAGRDDIVLPSDNAK